jgi:hypothetical protein
MPRQLSLFDAENRGITGIAGITVLIRAAMNRAAAASPYSREQIVERMNRLAQAAGKRMTQGSAKTISLDTLDKWLNPESDNVPSLVAVEVFMRAVGDTAPLAVWLEAHDCAIMTAEDRVLRDLGKNQLKKRRCAEEARALELKIKEIS